MDTLKIKAFLLVAKHHSFSKTAEEFSYTPSAVSHIADSLEEEIGVKLFERTRKGVELTKIGRLLYDKFSDVIKAENDLLEAAAFLAEKQKLSLKIGAYSSVALHILPEILQSFRQAYPSIKTTILVDDYMENWIEDGIADVIFADESVGKKQWYPFMVDEYVAVVPQDKFLNKEEISVKELYEYPFIRPDEAKLDDYLDYSKFKDVISVKSIENNSAVYMVKEKLGVTILPKLSMKSFPTGVKVLKLRPGISRTIGIVYEKERPWACDCFLRHIKAFKINDA